MELDANKNGMIEEKEFISKIEEARNTRNGKDRRREAVPKISWYSKTVLETEEEESIGDPSLPVS